MASKDTKAQHKSYFPLFQKSQTMQRICIHIGEIVEIVEIKEERL